MKKYLGIMFLSILVGILLVNVCSADVAVKGYYRSDGTYVKPHYRSNPNSYKTDNWSTKGNYNPYTGKKGTKKIDYNAGSIFNSNNNWLY